MVQKWRQNDYFFGNISSLGEVFGILQILVRSTRAPINKWGVFGIFTQKKYLKCYDSVVFVPHWRAPHQESPHVPCRIKAGDPKGL
jgi:hypothetical protein